MLKPLRDRLIVSVTKKTEEKSPSGLLHLPGSNERVVEGSVLSVGGGYLTDSGAVVPLEVSVGDTVVFDKQMAVEVKHHGETFFILREENILSVIN